MLGRLVECSIRADFLEFAREHLAAHLELQIKSYKQLANFAEQENFAEQANFAELENFAKLSNGQSVLKQKRSPLNFMARRCE